MSSRSFYPGSRLILLTTNTNDNRIVNETERILRVPRSEQNMHIVLLSGLDSFLTYRIQMSLAHHLRIFPYLEESLIECIYVQENEQMQKHVTPEKQGV